MMLGQAYEQLGDGERALEALADATRLSRGNSKPISLQGYLLAKAGRTTEAREVLRTLEERSAYVPPFAMALVHAGLGDRDATLQWLERAYAMRNTHLIFLTGDPKWRPFRSDPRFQRLLQRCGFTVAAGS